MTPSRTLGIARCVASISAPDAPSIAAASRLAMDSSAASLRVSMLRAPGEGAVSAITRIAPKKIASDAKRMVSRSLDAAESPRNSRVIPSLTRRTADSIRDGFRKIGDGTMAVSSMVPSDPRSRINPAKPSITRRRVAASRPACAAMPAMIPRVLEFQPPPATSTESTSRSNGVRCASVTRGVGLTGTGRRFAPEFSGRSNSDPRGLTRDAIGPTGLGAETGTSSESRFVRTGGSDDRDGNAELLKAAAAASTTRHAS